MLGHVYRCGGILSTNCAKKSVLNPVSFFLQRSPPVRGRAGPVRRQRQQLAGLGGPPQDKGEPVLHWSAWRTEFKRVDGDNEKSSERCLFWRSKKFFRDREKVRASSRLGGPPLTLSLIPIPIPPSPCAKKVLQTAAAFIP